MRARYVLLSACSLSMTVALAAQPPVKTAPVYIPPTPLYRMNDVGKALNLTPQQITNLNKVTDAAQVRYRDDYTKLGALSDADRFARMQELNQKYYTDWNKGARDVFNDTQLARYQQLQYQHGGFDALYDPAVQRQLNMTAEQQKNLRAQWDWSNQQLRDINRAGAADATKGTQMYRDYWTTRQERLNKFLTPEQQKAWTRMTGEPYTFQPTFSQR